MVFNEIKNKVSHIEEITVCLFKYSLESYLYQYSRLSYATIIFDNPRLILLEVVQSCAINDINFKMIWRYVITTSTTFCY